MIGVVETPRVSSQSSTDWFQRKRSENPHPHTVSTASPDHQPYFTPPIFQSPLRRVLGGTGPWVHSKPKNNGIFGMAGVVMNKRETLVFRRSDEWVHECVDKIVTAKRDMGLPTSFSYEVVRLLRAGLVFSLSGSELDRAILKGPET